jgi:DNA polymerase-2
VPEVLHAQLLTRQWFDRADGVQLTFWAASERGPVRLSFTKQESVFFIDRSAKHQQGRRRELELRHLDGAPVDALYFRSQRALNQERARLREDFARTMESTIKPHDRFLMERFITGSLTIEGKELQREGFLEFINPRVKRSEQSVDLKLLSFDIETDGFDGPLLSIAVAGHGDERVWMRGRAGQEDPSFVRVDDEVTMLSAFFDHVRTADPDILAGWNVVDFDLSYLQTRCEQLGVEFALGRGGERARVLAPRNDRQPAVARIGGRVVLDGIATLRSATYAFESFKLEDVGQELLGRGKKIEHSGDAMGEIRRLFAEDKAALAAYNLEDCRLVCDIFEAADLVGFAVERQALTGLPMDRQGGSVAAFDNLYLPRLHRAGYVAPDVEDLTDIVRSPVGYVIDSQPGLYENVLVLDFKSLYPSIIRTFAIDPLGLAVPGDDPIPGFEGGSFTREGHILPGLIEGLWSARDEAKRRKDAARSRAIKILMNSFYGVLGSGGCRFFSPKLASSITLRGHEIITESREFIEERGLSVIYGDTDSLFVLVGPESEARCTAIGRELEADLNTHWREHLRDTLDLESKLEIEFETH